MRMKYLTGYEADDVFFDLPESEQREHVAVCMGCHRQSPEGWPIGIIDKLIHVRRTEGKDPEFH